ncbi:hypothetical protein DSO57_1004427 [Entomophthora muscae]|uniref:Uncharacterized protein n=1 Tax=Entomophthora muscae TaxID=34485 RepID=A0ACC2TJG2_9FUNG|nr:hypothetical protein DSO57_1004427 [Entomophthora muscae]
MEKSLLGCYEARSRSIIQLVDRLRDEGAHYDIDLPTVVFCGNQSAGKSSLIEAISSIKLPRSDGTCTRCPMELRLSDSPAAWNCTISIQRNYDADGNSLNMPSEVLFMDNLSNPDDVELQVRRAQKAILNPSQNTATFRDHRFDDTSSDARIRDTENNELKFTANTVCLKITGASANLTLVDLPGIIRTTENAAEAGFIAMVEGMVKNYVKNPRALIIATVSCKDEIENQAILSLAKEADPDGNRTIGVLTKPDTIEASCHDTWFQILNNRRYTLRLGYYIVKNPTKQELDANIDFTMARNNERRFFSCNQPWSVAHAGIQSRMGVDQLRMALSQQLTELIEASLPSMRTKVKELLDLANMQLRDMPEPITQNPKLEILSRIKAFDRQMLEMTSATSTDKSAFQKINQHFKGFNRRIYEARPILLIPKSDRVTTTDSKATQSLLRFSSKKEGNEFTPEQLQRILDSQHGREFSQFIKYEALQEVVRQCQSEWKADAMACIEQVEEELKLALARQIKECFGRFQGLAFKVQTKMEELLQRLTEDTISKIVMCHDMEVDYPATWDTERLETLVHSIHDKLEVPLNEDALEDFDTSSKESVQKALISLENIGIRTTKSKLPTLIPNLYNAKVRQIMDISMAYYEVAQSRYGDNVPMLIFRCLVQAISKELEPHLIQVFDLLGSDNQGLDCARFLEESPVLASRRKEVTSRIQRLNEVRRHIYA